jgi:hypothetical protein
VRTRGKSGGRGGTTKGAEDDQVPEQRGVLQVRRSPSHLQTVERGWTGVGGWATGLSILWDFDRGGVRC